MTGQTSIGTTKKTLHCAVCGDEITSAPIRKHKQNFCCEWHAKQYKPPAPWWKRLFKDRGTPQGTGCG
jgi:hypothetical protein